MEDSLKSLGSGPLDTRPALSHNRTWRRVCQNNLKKTLADFYNFTNLSRNSLLLDSKVRWNQFQVQFLISPVIVIPAIDFTLIYQSRDQSSPKDAWIRKEETQILLS